MVRLSGSEASALAYLAEYPQAEDRDDFLERLVGEARKIAEELVHGGTQDVKVRAAAGAIRRWADRKAER